MEEAFDPYRKWLGIPPEEQPPNHYRLLGIALFEDDPDVISNAADRQMAHVRTFQIGKRAPLSQALLNELSAAKVCLLDPTKKKVYDAELAARHARLPRAVAAPVAAAAPPGPPAAVPGVPVGASAIPVAAPVAGAVVKPASRAVEPVTLRRSAGSRANAATAVEEPLPITVSTRGIRPRSARRSSPAAAIIVFAALGLLALLVLYAAFFLSGDGAATDNSGGGNPPAAKKARPGGDAGGSSKTAPSGATENLTAKTNGDARPTVRPTPSKSPDRSRVASQTPPKDAAESPEATSPDGDRSEPPVSTPQDDKTNDAKPDDAAPPSEATPGDEEDAPSRSAVTQKRPPPSPAAIDKAYRIVRKDFEPQLREAREPEERFDVARQMLERAASTDEPATQYALYLLARNLGVQMASAEQAFEAIDLLTSQFAVDAFEMKRQVLDDISQFVTLELDDYAHLLTLMQRTAREALAAQNSDAAVALSRLAKGTSLKVRSPKALKELPRLEDLLADVDRLAADVAEYDREVKSFDRNMKLVERDANDPAANLGVGRYWLLVKGDWTKALPHLAKGVDPAWKDPATIDLAAPQTAAEQVALGDAWRELAARKGGFAAPRLLERSKMWYARAVAAAGEGEKTAIEGKIAEVERLLKSLAPPHDSADGAPPAGSKPNAATPNAPPAEPTPSPDADDGSPAFPDRSDGGAPGLPSHQTA